MFKIWRDMKTRRICCFCETWESGGIESFLNNVLLRMDLSGLEVDIVAACIKESVFTLGLESKGIQFVPLSGAVRDLRKNFAQFRELLRERHYDVVHFNLFQGLSLYYVQIAKEEKVPVRIAHCHGSGLRNSRTKQLKLILHRLGRYLWKDSATEYWACSQAAANFLFSNELSVRVIPNGIDTNRFSFDAGERERVRRQLGMEENYVVGNVGRLSSEKNQQFLLETFAHLSRMRPESRLLLVGDGVEKTMLQRSAEQLGIAENVTFYGTSKQVEKLLWAMDVFAFPSLFEGLGIACVEAQAAGLPVVCSEGVPKEAHISPLIKAVKLSDGTVRWAEELSCCGGTEISRMDGVPMVRGAGFDSSDVAKMIETTFRR